MSKIPINTETRFALFEDIPSDNKNKEEEFLLHEIYELI